MCESWCLFKSHFCTNANAKASDFTLFYFHLFIISFILFHLLFLIVYLKVELMLRSAYQPPKRCQTCIRHVSIIQNVKYTNRSICADTDANRLHQSKSRRLLWRTRGNYPSQMTQSDDTAGGESKRRDAAIASETYRL